MLSLSVHLERADFSLQIDAEVPVGPVALVGPNGSGKSTLLRILAGGIRPRGRVVVGGHVWSDATTWVPPEARRVGFLPQNIGLFPHLSALKNVAYGDGSAGRLDNARSWLARLGVESLSDRRARVLSGGEQQRVGLARALASRPKVLLLDEPLASLDVRVGHEVRKLLADALRIDEGLGVVSTHHGADLRAWAPHVLVLEKGRVVASGPVDDVRAHPFVDALLS